MKYLAAAAGGAALIDAAFFATRAACSCSMGRNASAAEDTGVDGWRLSTMPKAESFNRGSGAEAMARRSPPPITTLLQLHSIPKSFTLSLRLYEVLAWPASRAGIPLLISEKGYHFRPKASRSEKQLHSIL